MTYRITAGHWDVTNGRSADGKCLGEPVALFDQSFPTLAEAEEFTTKAAMFLYQHGWWQMIDPEGKRVAGRGPEDPEPVGELPRPKPEPLIPRTASELIDWLRSRADGHDIDTDLFEQAAAMLERLAQGLNSDIK